ncbi:MAG: hydrogenase expression/formation protein HypE [Deltaproteobacteria bacterium]|nr:hydrogenase expression/formation protein HypE [Deltaproteobacteria bacterium]
MRGDRVQLDHGSGGEASQELVCDIFLRRLRNDYLEKMDDSALVDLPGCRLAMTTDSYVVDPIFFPGGDIGALAVHGTINDLSMQGARPMFLTLGLILEEGFALEDLKRVIDSVATASKEADVKIVAGDTKVVPRGHADRIFINTAGIGIVPPGVRVGADNAQPGDVVIINGTIGDHGLAVMTRREGLALEAEIHSDSAPLNALTEAALQAGGPGLHVLRDPTRGGVATALNEIARLSGVRIELAEKDLPVAPAVESACELLGLDPLYVANEGKCLLIAHPAGAPAVLEALRGHPLGHGARIIGKVRAARRPGVLLKTRVGGTRILSMLTGEQLPRIC